MARSLARRECGREDLQLPGGTILVPRGGDLSNGHAQTREHSRIHRSRQQRCVFFFLSPSIEIEESAPNSVLSGWKLSPVVVYRLLTARNTTGLSFQPSIRLTYLELAQLQTFASNFPTQIDWINLKGIFNLSERWEDVIRKRKMDNA